MPRIWTWLSLVVATAGIILLVDLFDGPAGAWADPGTSLTAPIAPPSAEQRVGGVRNKIGWTAAHRRMGRDLPTGQGVAVGQVEAVARGGYIANGQHAELRSTTFIPQSGPSGTSPHATTVARSIVGQQSAAPGVRAVYAWSVNHWLADGGLNTHTTNPPSQSPARVMNHSWVGGDSPQVPVILRRIDYLIDTQDVLVVCGVGNENGPIPPMLASAYNVISVGVISGQHSDALTHTEGDGRCKPEIVAPAGLTSWATGIVTGVAAALVEYADRIAEADERNADAARSEVIKAVMLGGALRPRRWSAPDGEPLDRQMGAGMVEIDRALVMLEAGHVAPDTQTNQRYGWSFAHIAPDAQHTYRFTIDTRQGEAGFALVWHRRVHGGTTQVPHPDTGEPVTLWHNGDHTPNLDLTLVRIRNSNEEIIAASTSAVDNLELIHLRTLAPGEYELRVNRHNDPSQTPWDFALAWRIEAQQ